jgi:hypothetical protein
MYLQYSSWKMRNRWNVVNNFAFNSYIKDYLPIGIFSGIARTAQ